MRTNSTCLSKCISDHRGLSWKPYIADLRLTCAAEKLASDTALLRLSVEAIAGECGFSSRSHFSDSFLRRFGMRPHEYLEACRRGEPPLLNVISKSPSAGSMPNQQDRDRPHL